MKINRAIGFWFLCLLALNAVAEDDTMRIGTIAPGFSLADQSGNLRALADYRGRWLVLYFYPKDDTPGCTTEACALRDDYLGLTQLNAQVVGVSVDDTASHAAFAKKFNLPFPLLADEGGAVAKRYGALSDWWFWKIAKRHTFIIDPNGNIAKIYHSVDPKSHSGELIADLKALQAK